MVKWRMNKTFVNIKMGDEYANLSKLSSEVDLATNVKKSNNNIRWRNDLSVL